MDRSFWGLFISVALHVLLVVLLFRMPTPPPLSLSDKTEITVLDPDDAKAKKAQRFVTETEKKQVDLKDLKDLKDTADYLSQFTKRVKKQLVARQIGPTRNSQPTVIPLQPKETSDRDRVKGPDTDNRPSTDEAGIGLPRPGGNHSSMRQVMIGPSSIREHIPGVETADFTALNTDQFTYYSFYNRMNEQVYQRWVEQFRNYMSGLSFHDREVLARMDRKTTVEIVLSKDGQFHSSVLHRSSGFPGLDQTTIDAFREAAPFLNPPRGMVGEDSLIHLHYAFSFIFRPPLNQAGS